MNNTGKLGAGAAIGAFIQGSRLALFDPALRKVVITSLVVNALVFLALLAGIWFGVGALEVEGDAWWQTALNWAITALQVFALVIAFLWAPVIYQVLAEIVMPMFQEPVFRAAREHAGAAESESRVSTVASIAITLRRLAIFLVLSLLLLLLNIVPVLGNLAYLVGQFLLTSRELGWDLITYHCDVHDMRFGEQKAFVARNRTTVLAIGAVATLLLMVPVLQLLFITTNVAGAGVVSARLDGAGR